MERRRYPRIPVNIHAEVEIYLDSHCCKSQTEELPSIKGVVNTIDIGLGGFCVKAVRTPGHTEKSFSPAIAYMLVGKMITAYFKDYEMAVSGKVVRVDPETMLMAVVITNVSNINCWRRLCGQTIFEQSCG